MNAVTTRRSLLKGVTLGAGAGILNPILAHLAAHAAGAPEAVRKRVVFVVQGNGFQPRHLLPSGVERPRDGRPQNTQLEEIALKGRTLHKAIEPLTPFLDRLTIVQGLSGKIAYSDHSANHGALGAYPAKKGPMAQTIDLALSEVLPGVVPHVGLGLASNLERTMNYDISASAPGKAVPIICAPDLAFRGLFGSVASGTDRLVFDRRTTLLDFMADDVKRSRAALVAEEREKFDQYLQAFEALRDRQAKIEAIREPLRANLPQIDEKLKKPTEVNRFDAQFEIAAAALISGLTNVVTLVSGGGGQHYVSYPDLGIPVDGHHYGHGNGVEGKTAEECFVTVRQYHARLIAKFAERLQGVREGDGTMLDNTLIVWLSDSGDAHHPTGYEWPVVLLGNLGGRLKTNGRYLQFPTYGAKAHRTTANLYCTFLYAAGRGRDTFGVADPGLRDIDQTGPIPELLA